MIRKYTVNQIKQYAKELIISNEVPNELGLEYNRGICELIADLDGIRDVPHEDRATQIAIELNCVIKRNSNTNILSLRISNAPELRSINLENEKHINIWNKIDFLENSIILSERFERTKSGIKKLKELLLKEFKKLPLYYDN